MTKYKKILIVDDEPSILHTLSHFLKVNGNEVLTSSEMSAAEYMIKSTKVDLVLADIRLTGVLGREGLELLSYIKEHSEETTVIIMTGYGSPEIEKEAYDRGAYYYIDKPIRLHALHERLSKLGIGTKFSEGPKNDK